jgi:hypothetical protein
VPSKSPPIRLDPPPPPPKPSPYARLHGRAYAALQSAGLAVTGEQFSVFGIGDPSLPLMGWCPVCRRGTVAVWLVDADPPRIRLDDGCSAGCAPEVVAKALR